MTIPFRRAAGNKNLTAETGRFYERHWKPPECVFTAAARCDLDCAFAFTGKIVDEDSSDSVHGV